MAIALAVLVLLCLGTPVKYAKFRGGHMAAWVGFEVDHLGHRLGISASRAECLRAWMEKTCSEEVVSPLDISAFLGKTKFHCRGCRGLEALPRSFVWVGLRSLPPVPSQGPFVCQTHIRAVRKEAGRLETSRDYSSESRYGRSF